MPRDMTVQRPRARVVRRDLQDQEPARRQDLHVPPLRVRRVDHGPVPGPRPDVLDEHVVPVQVDGVGEEARVGHVDADARVGAEVVHVPLRAVRVRVVAQVGEQQDGLVVVGAEGGLVHGPDPVARGVLAEVDVDVRCYGGIWVRGDGEPGGG